ncbi:MAG: hypothetical protein AB9903_28505 [Vulcanimicrobiota bacterium]
MNTLTCAPGYLGSREHLQRAESPSAKSPATDKVPQNASSLYSGEQDSISLSGNALNALNEERGETSSSMNSLQNDWTLNPFENFRKLKSAFQYNGKEGPDAFGQGREGNCATVAVIKAGMDAFGDDLFKTDDFNSETGAHSLGLRDGSSLQISKDDYETARRNTNFNGAGGKDDEYATLYYSAVAKNLMQNNGYADMQQACDDLNDGFDARQSAKMLGLGGDIHNIDKSAITSTGIKEDELEKHDAIVARRTGVHAIYIDNDEKEGLQSDHYGTMVKYDGTDTWDGEYLNDAFAFK